MLPGIKVRLENTLVVKSNFIMTQHIINGRECCNKKAKRLKLISL